MMLNDGPTEENPQVLKSLSQGYDCYEVRLQRDSMASHFGLGYRCVSQNTGLVITAICDNSLVTEWNKACDLVNTMCVGDRIVSINGKEDAKALVQELSDGIDLNMKILKAGPRWHLDGATAECMRKIEWAMAKGLKFETRALDMTDVGTGTPQVVSSKPLCGHYIMLTLCTLLPASMVIVAFSDIFYGLTFYAFFASWYWNLGGNFLAGLASIYALCLYLADWTQWRNPVQKFSTAIICIYGFCFAFFLKCRFYPYAPLIISLFHIAFFMGLLRSSLARNLTRAAFYKASWRACCFSACCCVGIWLVYIFMESWDGGNMWNETTKNRLAADSKTIYDKVFITVDGERRALSFEWDCREKDKRTDNFRMISDTLMESTGYQLSREETSERDGRCSEVKTIWFLMWVSPFVTFMTLAVIGTFSFLNTWDFTTDSSGVEKLIKGAISGVCSVLMLMWVSASVAAANMQLTSTLMAFCASAMIALMIWCYLEIGKRAITSSIKESKMMQMLIMLATSNWIRAGLIIAFNVLIPFGFVLSYLNQRVRKLRGRATTDGRLTDGAERVLKSLMYWNWGNIFIKVNCLVMIYWTFFVGIVKWTYVFLSHLNGVLETVDLGVVIIIFFAIGFTMFLLPPVPGVPVYITSGVIIAARASTTQFGFWGGISIACALSFVLKLSACSGQYLIGYLLGKAVKVQQMVGVDKIFMRAVEKILLERGFNRAKVAVLIGGPDWPTSVICGILKLNLCQILLGTTPVIFVSSPCVFAGAFLSGPSAASAESEAGEENEIYSTLASTLLAVSIAIQMGSMLVALYYIQDVIGKHSTELGKWRADHAPVVALRDKETEGIAAWNDVLQWSMLGLFDRVLILISVCMMLMALFLFGMMDEACHRPFQVNNDIQESFGNNGLYGNALNIVLPMGWFATGLFFFGSFLHLIFVLKQKIRAKKHLKWKRENPSLSKNRQSSVVAPRSSATSAKST